MALVWLKRVLDGSSAASRLTASAPERARRNFRPNVECLEERVVPVTGVTDLTTLTAQSLVNALVGSNPGITVSNVQYHGDLRAAGTFTGGQNSVGMSDGVIFSTGIANQAVGPHTAVTPSTILGTPDGGPGDPQLDALAGAPGATVDASVLEFDFVPTGNTINLSYIFGSGDYNAGIAGPGDVFGIFVNGVNTAFVPGTTTPINVTTVNGAVNSQFFVDNTLGSRNTRINGFTTVLGATLTVHAGVTNHIKFAIADAGTSIGGTITGATNASPIAITTTLPHGLATGNRVTIAGVTGNTAANGTFIITVTGANTFTLNGSTGNGAYVSGGTWSATGLVDSYLLLGAQGATAGNGAVLGGLATANVNAYRPLRYVFNGDTATFDGNLTVVSRYPSTLTGTNVAVLSNLPAAVSLANPNGTTASGNPFLTLPTVGTQPGVPLQQPVRVLMKLRNPGRVYMSSFFENITIDVTTALI
jgi:hypothetical protein